VGFGKHMSYRRKIHEIFLKNFDAPRFNDVYLRPKNQIIIGDVALGSKAAIYLIFPKSGLLESHIVALKYMIQEGYSPIVVSNLPLPKSDTEKIKSLTYRILERQNFGYDFGGYREAIMVFQNEIRNLDYLALFNDSVWFPVNNSNSWLKDAEMLQKDFVGALSHAELDRKDLNLAIGDLSTGTITNKPAWIDPQSWLKDFSNRLRNYSKPPRFVLKTREFLRERRKARLGILFHYCSFALLLNSAVLKEPEFYQFWKTLKISNDWVKTILRGEVGFSTWMINHNFSHGSTVDSKSIDQKVSDLSDDQLSVILSKMAIYRNHRALVEILFEKDVKSLEIQTFQDKQILLKTLLKLDTMAYSAVHFLHHIYGFQFFKKKNFTTSDFGRKVAIELIPEMSEPVKSEMLKIVQDTSYCDDPTDKNRHLSGKRKVFGIWVGVPRLWH
jgi:hypothetical protein